MYKRQAGYCLRVDVSYTVESCCERLRIYDGNTTGSPLVYNLGGSGTGTASWIGGSQSLTFNFTSDGSVVNPGYSATLTCLSVCSGTPVGGTISIASSNSVTCPTAGSVTINSAGGTTGCGIAYQWQSATSASGPWSNIAAPAGISYNLIGTFNGTTYFRRMVCCGVNCAYSNTISIGSGAGSTCGLSNYSAAAIAYAPDVFVGTATPSTDDVLYNNIAMFGFNFCYTGATYWGGYIASNTSFVFNAVPCFPNIQAATYAAAGVGTGWSMAAGSPAPVNGTSIPRNAVLGPWHDANPVSYTHLIVSLFATKKRGN